ncbi:hypothetical protein BJY24_007070 [Nocardia transvalensis]|uniref:Uncharacterized protein n=1 Tax=Nocardia transvalensis TaxID=37333 RepID=A0A7W9PME7_9NOCA|nr:hypothetical protein [Nocardia transvalensis]MBB5918158.1 hypothetical protein [Nocardia transvalensis]
MAPPPPSAVPTPPPAGPPLRIGEATATRSLEIIGLDRDDIDVRAARVLASTLDDLLAKYPIPLHGIEIEERRDDGLPILHVTGSGQRRRDDTALWVVIDHAALTGPSGRRWFRRGFDRAICTAVAQGYARALDRAGGFRAHERAWQTVLNHSLRKGNDTYSPLDPAQALADGFTEVVLRGKRAGKTARLLHDALTTAASNAAESPGLPQGSESPGRRISR